MTEHPVRAPMTHVRMLGLFMFAMSLMCPFSLSVSAQEVPELEINSEAYIVIDADTGEIFAQKNADEQRAMASLTKVFTAIEAIKRAPLDQTITTTEDDVFDDSSTRVGFGAGEQFTLTDLIYGMLLPSGNDAAHAIARSIGTQAGDSDEQGYERFIAWMNERLQMMGLTDTNLVNPHGWGVAGHHSTAHDLATFMRYAIQEPAFLEAISTSGYSTANGYSFSNTNKLLNSYPFILGGKTGYDDDAGYCLIEVAQQDGRTMISVTLDGVAPDDWYDDNRVLLDYAFEQVNARDGAIEGDIAAFNDPDVALLSSAASTGAIHGTQFETTANVQPTPPSTQTEEPQTADAANAETGSSQVDAASQADRSVPGISLPLAIALAVAAVFIVIAGRELRNAETPFGAVVRSSFQRGRTPKTARAVKRTRGSKSTKDGASAD